MELKRVNDAKDKAQSAVLRAWRAVWGKLVITDRSWGRGNGAIDKLFNIKRALKTYSARTDAILIFSSVAVRYLTYSSSLATLPLWRLQRGIVQLQSRSL